MKNNPQSQSGIFSPRVIGAFLLCSAGIVLAMLSFAATPPNGITGAGGKTPGTSLFVGRYAQPISGNAKAWSASVPVVQSTTSGWSVVSSPNDNNNPNDYDIEAVTCTSAADCWAVGHYHASDGYQETLTEHWNGSAWAIVYSPNYSASQFYATDNNYLSGVVCASASDCWAVGYYDYHGLSNTTQTLIMHWNGSGWGLIGSPNNGTQDNLINNVKCTSASQCWAVGHYNNSAGIEQTLIEQWDGNSWSIVTSPNNSTTQNNVLNGLKCVSASDCWATGSYVSGSGYTQTLIEHWNGAAWFIFNSPNTSSTQNNQLNAVACTSASNCWAAGSYVGGSGSTQTLIEHWNGSSWSIVTSPNTSSTQNNDLSGVSCGSASDCSAVGDYVSNSGIRQTLIERWNGSSWSIVTSPNPNNTPDNRLKGVTCVSTSECWAIGDYFTDSNVEQTFTEHWNGSSWALVASVNGTLDNILNGVACASASNCWAVGNSVTLIQHWDGGSWSLVTSPSLMTSNNYLADVKCTSTSDCWAVGYHNNDPSSVRQTLVMHWNGTSWDPVASPNGNNNGDNSLNSVACASASDCWAVGYYVTDYPFNAYTLTEHWNGSSWTIVPSPNFPSSHSNSLGGVTCASASDCWAVGSWSSSSSYYLIEHWNGTSWSLVPATGGPLYSVTCISGSDCWAVGYNHLHWDGHIWTSVSAPTGARSVTCAATSDCWAVSSVIEHWDGTSWDLIDSPNGEGPGLLAVACPSASECWAVGGSTNGYSYQTLIERYVPPVQLPSVVSRKTHGVAGTFDVTLPLTGKAGVECRTSGASGGHQVIATFANPVTFSNASIASGNGSVSDATINGSQVTLNLTGVSNAQTVILRFTGVNDGTNSADISVPMGILLGDTTANGSVNASDLAQTKSQSGQAASAFNFREDVTADGVINASDTGAVKAAAGTALP
jgi:hypothetical protein